MKRMNDTNQRKQQILQTAEVSFLKGCSNEPPFEHPRENMVKLYQVQCSNEPLPFWNLSRSAESYLLPSKLRINHALHSRQVRSAGRSLFFPDNRHGLSGFG